MKHDRGSRLPHILTTGDLAATLGVGKATIRRYANRDGAPHQKSGAGYLFDEHLFRAWARKRYYVLRQCSNAGLAFLTEPDDNP